MKRLILAVCSAALALTVSACNFGGEGTVRSAATIAASSADAIGLTPPTPAANTAADERAVTLAAASVDTAAITASALVRTCAAAAAVYPSCPFLAGSPSARRIATGLDRARHGVNAAAAARRAGNSATYRAALAEAEAALAEVRSAIGG